MKPVSQIRRERLADLVAQAGSQVAVAEKIGKDKNQVYQWLLEPDAPGARNIGPNSARHIETAFSKPAGWLDHEADSFSGVSEPSPTLYGTTSYGARLSVPILAQALRIVSADEAVNGSYGWEKQAEVLLDLCTKLEAGEDPYVLGIKLTHARQTGEGSNGNKPSRGDNR
jgi:hypothetical protein